MLNYRPDLLGKPNTEDGDPKNYLSRTTVINPPGTRPFGTAGRNVATAPATFMTDVRIQKTFPLHWEKSRLEFQAECFNLLNKTNFRSPAANRATRATRPPPSSARRHGPAPKE